MKLYESIKAFACNSNCAESFKCDREHGLIYGPYRFENGDFALTWEQASRRDFFCAYCGQKATLEIQSNGSWCKVSPQIFRSWTGKRRVDGKKYIGPRYSFGTFEPIPQGQKTID